MPSSYRYEYRDGRLFLSSREGEGVYRVDPWPQPRSEVRLVAGGEWIPCPPPMRLLQPLRSPRAPRPAAVGSQLELALRIERQPSRAVEKYHALRQFRARLPGPVMKAVEQLRTLQWDALVACSLSDRFAQLLAGNPALAWLWLSHCQRRGFCQAGAADLLAARVAHGGETSQRQLLRQLELRSSKAAVKLLRKIHLSALQPGNADLLRTILCDDRRMERLRHVSRLGTGLLEVARSTRVLYSCSPTLLTEVSTRRDELLRAPTAARVATHLAMLDELGMPLPRPFRSRDDLLHQHRELMDGFHVIRHELEQNVPPPPPPPPRPPVPAPAPAPARPPAPVPAPRPSRPKPADGFPDPPLPGNPHIVPLTSRAQLRAEGRAQSNCVAGYSRFVKNGSLYIYKVLWPQRCTLSLRKGRDGRWTCGELESAGNRGARAETKRMVEDWIRASQPRVGPPS